MLEFNVEKKDEIWKYFFFWALKAHDNIFEYVAYHEKKKVDQKNNETVILSDN